MTAHHYTDEEIARAIRIVHSLAGSRKTARKADAVRRNGMLGGRPFSGGRVRTIAREYIRSMYGDLRKIKDKARRASIVAEAREYAVSEAQRRAKLQTPQTKHV